jgi:hypothetical protein
MTKKIMGYPVNSGHLPKRANFGEILHNGISGRHGESSGKVECHNHVARLTP